MPYDVPGRADRLAPGLVQSWNDRIAAELAQQDAGLKTRFISLDPATVGSTAAVPSPGWWPADRRGRRAGR